MFFRRIKLLILVGFAFGVSLGGLLWSSPWWLPVAAPPLLGLFDVQVEASRSALDGRWRVEGLSFKLPGTHQVRVEYAEMPGLWAYGEALLDGRRWTARHNFEIGATTVRLRRGGDVVEVEGAGRGGWSALFSDLREVSAVADHWLPPVSVASIRVERIGEGLTLEGTQVYFGDGSIRLEIGDEALGHGVLLELGLDPQVWEARAEITDLDLGIHAQLRQVGAKIVLHGEAKRAKERIEMDAVFIDGQVFPSEASIETSGFPLPDSMLPNFVAPGFRQARLEQAALRWADGRYHGTLRLTASSTFEKKPSPVRAEVELDGDLEQLRVSELGFQAAWLEASLEAPLVVAFRDWTVSGPARFQVTSDLTRQSFFGATGTLHGTVEAQASGVIRFDVDGDAIRLGDYGLSRLEVQGRIDRSEVEVESMSVTLPESAGGQLDFSGSYQFQESYLKIRYNGIIDGDFFQEYAGVSWFQDPVVLSGQIQGNPLAPEVRGQLECRLVDFPSMKPAALSAEYSYQVPGSGLIDLVLRRGDEQIELAVEGSFERGAAAEGEVKALALKSGGEYRVRLTQPAAFRLPPAETLAQRFTLAEIGRFEVSGPGGRGLLVKEAGGALEMELRACSVGLLNNWLERALPDLTVRFMDLKLSDLSPEVAGDLDLILEEKRALGLVQAKLINMEAGPRLSFDAFELSLDQAVVLKGVGNLPISMGGPDAEAGSRLRVDPGGELNFQAETLSAASLSAILKQWTGLETVSPEFHFELGGTMQAPRGRGSLRADLVDLSRIQFGAESGEPLPVLQDIQLRFRADGRRVQVEHLEASIRGGRIQATGEWLIPGELLSGQLGTEDWAERLVPNRLEFSFAEWEVENWTAYLPEMLRRSGRLSGAVRYRSETGVNGSLTFGGFALRPTQNFPSVDSIEGEVRVEDRVLTLSGASAQVGGSPVRINGDLDLTAWPRSSWGIGIAGENVPIVRRSDIILRSDLDVALKSGAEPGDTELSGHLDLRSSTMLVELDPLSPSTASSPAARPPFFEVAEAPFNAWALNLRIEGDRFLRVRSPYIRALLSAGFDLSGTLGQPLLIGGLRVEEGQVRFPGANLRIDSGEAYIEAATPNTLRLDLAGTARTGTHVISMQVKGSATDPQIQFEASPPLPSGMIVRLLSTGSVVGGGGGSVGLYLGRGLLGTGGMGESLGDRLTVEIGEETTRSGRSAFGFRYDINENLSLQSEYDFYDSYNMDLLWTIFKR